MKQSQLRQLIRECINEINIETPSSRVEWSKKYKLPHGMDATWVDNFRPVGHSELNSILQKYPINKGFQFGVFALVKIPHIDESLTWLIPDIYFYPDDFNIVDGIENARTSFKEFWDKAFNDPDRTWWDRIEDNIQYYFDVGQDGPALSAEQLEDITIKYINVFAPLF